MVTGGMRQDKHEGGCGEECSFVRAHHFCFHEGLVVTAGPPVRTGEHTTGTVIHKLRRNQL